MNVKELIEKLQAFDPDCLVVMASDTEGNSYDILYGVWECSYKDGEARIRALTPALRNVGYTEEDLMEGGENAVCLQPRKYMMLADFLFGKGK